MLTRLKLLTLGLSDRPVAHHRCLRLEPLESRSLLSATGILLPAGFRSLVAATAPNVTARVVETAPAQFAALANTQELPDYASKALHNPLALAPLTPTVPVLKATGMAIDANALNSSPLASVQLVDGPVARTVQNNALSLTASSSDSVAGVMAIAGQRLQDAFTFIATNYGAQTGGAESQRDNVYVSMLWTFESNVMRPEGGSPPALQSSPNVHASTPRTLALHALSVSREAGSVGDSLLNTALAGNLESRNSVDESQRAQTADTTDNGSVVTLSSADLAEAIDLLASGAVLPGQEGLDSLTLINSGDAASDDAGLESALDKALPDLISPLANTSATLADAVDESGYVRIGTSKSSKAGWNGDQYDALRRIWQDGQSATPGASFQTAEQASAGRLEAQALKNRLRRGGQASDDEGMIELVVASSSNTVQSLSNQLGYSDGVSSIAARDVRMHEAVGQFQAFELAGSGDEGSMAPAARGAAVASAAEPSATQAAAADEAINVQPVQQAATAIGIVVLSMLTAVHDKRKAETVAERDNRHVANDRSTRIDRLS